MSSLSPSLLPILLSLGENGSFALKPPLDRGLFPLLDFLRKHLQSSPNTDWKPFSAVHQAFRKKSMNLFPLNYRDGQVRKIAGWHEARTVLFSCVDMGRPSALSHNGKGTVWMELTWAWKMGVRKGHQPTRTRGSGKPCPSPSFPLPC